MACTIMLEELRSRSKYWENTAGLLVSYVFEVDPVVL